MKKHICILLAAVLSVSLTGCQFDLPRTSLPFPFSLIADSTAPSADTSATAPATTAAATTVPETTAPPTVPPTVPPTTVPPATEPSPYPYIQRIYSHDQRIFKEPSYDSRYAGTVRTAGRYTIVDERYDSEGNLWGKLKSGAGWVDLTDIDRVNADKPVVTAADLNYTPTTPYDTFGEPGEYTVPIIIHCYADDAYLELYSDAALELGFNVGTVMGLHHIITKDVPLVLNLDFYGDMTAFILECHTPSQVYYYHIYQSGRNGLVEFVPIHP